MQPGSGKFEIRRASDRGPIFIDAWQLNYPDGRFELYYRFDDALEQMDDLIAIYRSRLVRENARRGVIAHA